jgi:hypothetical protein
MLIPERALPELLAELQHRPDTSAPSQPHAQQQEAAAPRGEAQRGSLYDIMAGVQR